MTYTQNAIIHKLVEIVKKKKNQMLKLRDFKVFLCCFFLIGARFKFDISNTFLKGWCRNMFTTVLHQLWAYEN